MKQRSTFLASTIITCCLFLLVSCSSKKAENDLATFSTPSIEKMEVHTILVFPVESSKTEDLDYTKTRQIEAGLDILTSVLEDELSENKEVTFISNNQIESLLGDISGNKTAQAQHVANQLGGDAVLLATLNRFVERDGRSRSVNEPASVSFDFRLIHTETGKTLCLGVFDETQQTLFSNIFTFSKAKKRGFKWISAEELTREGVNEKLEECSYLSK